VPIPHTSGLTDFLAEARKARADYLFVSETEVGLVRQLSVLGDPGVALPGMVPLLHRVLPDRHYLAVYRFVPSTAPRAVFEDSLLAAILRFAARRPGEAWPLTYLGGHLVSMERYREALAPLARAERLDPTDALTARFQATAHAELGEFDQAAAACERTLRRLPDAAWERGYLGVIRLSQGRYVEAREHLARAMEGAPTDPRYPVRYLTACAGAGAWQEAASMADKILRITPDDATARLFGARAWLALGHPEKAHALAAWSGVATGPDSARWVALADSLRAGRAGAK
jgi:tetratricopeptide (TPR) repeat protein